MNITAVATWTGEALLVAAALFQAALAVGVPWGAAAYGGRAARPDGSLPPQYRLSSAVTVVLLATAGWALHAAVGPVVWGLAALFLLNTAANLAARHPVERWGMGLGTLALAGCCVLVAWS